MIAPAFLYEALPARVIFGRGTLAQLSSEADRQGLARLIVLSTPGQSQHADRVAALLGDRASVIFTGAAMHTPVDVTEKALVVALGERTDGIVAVGGGS